MRRGQQRKREERRAKRMLGTRPGMIRAGSYQPPPREDCESFVTWYPLDDLGTVRIWARTWRHEGRLVDFVLQLDSREWDTWIELERVDCCRGLCHVHPTRDKGIHDPIASLDTLDEVERAMQPAYKRLEQTGRRILGGRGDD